MFVFSICMNPGNSFAEAMSNMSVYPQVSVGGCGATLKEIAKNPPPASDAVSKGGSAKGGKAPAKGAKAEVSQREHLQ